MGPKLEAPKGAGYPCCSVAGGFHYEVPFRSAPTTTRTMSDLCSPSDFRLILDFAIGIADRGLPLAVVRLAPDGDGEVPEGPSLDRLRVAVAYLCRKTDRVSMPRNGQFDVLLVDCNRQGALIFADRVLQGLETWQDVAGISLGCGIACFAPNLSTTDSLLKAADEARKRSFDVQDRIEIYGG